MVTLLVSLWIKKVNACVLVVNNYLREDINNCSI